MIGIPCRTTLFCDFDGPIVDVSDRYYATYQLALRRLAQTMGIVHSPLPWNILTKSQFWYLKQQRIPDFEIAIRSGIQEKQFDQFLSIVHDLVNQPGLLHHDSLQPGIRWALEFMHSQGVRLILVTLRRQSQVEEFLQAHHLKHLFKAVWGTQDIGAAYENSAAYKTALLRSAWEHHRRHYGMPQQAWMVGDTEADILAGKAHGIETVALTCGIRSRAYLAQYQPSHICEDLVSVTHSLVHGSHVASA